MGDPPVLDPVGAAHQAAVELEYVAARGADAAMVVAVYARLVEELAELDAARAPVPVEDLLSLGQKVGHLVVGEREGEVGLGRRAEEVERDAVNVFAHWHK